ncbi:carboxylating nicotinate-nucleotide diphosphorylase [Sulfolobus sp. SCGC AB-777_L09]|jgi:nicotinate-nucleotide pyrophosphorylase (carboxylating)|nr:carboxylating nicotinate-nucleotide diphosphorylase [Sulfolobus sp. SCGC AB-777_L09]
MIEKLVLNKLLQFLEEDVLPEDVTSKIVRGIKCKAYIKAKDEGLLAGVKFLKPLYEYFNIKFEGMDDGSLFRKGDIIITLEGDAETILAIERLSLNLLSRLSAIATTTKKMVESAREVNPNVIIAGTRKTTPGLRIFEKYAIEIGGGDPHRYNLSDMVLIKDNHISLIGSVREAVTLAKKITSFTKKIEVEVSDLKSALEAYEAGADAILLDNMSPKEVEEIVSLLKDKVILEASGRITPENVKDYAKTGVDIISSGYLTHSVKALDLSLDVERIS